MQTKIFSDLLLLTTLIVILSPFIQGQRNEVSSKLDFDESDSNTNDTVPVVPGIKQSKNNQHDDEKGKESETSRGGKSGPKIHGVRITVDTGDTQKPEESKEGVEVTDLGSNKKRVGIHTDITFEITAEGDDHTNKTGRERDMDMEEEDVSVPIFKGKSSSTHKTQKPYDPKFKWNPNFSGERRSDHPSAGNYPDYYPEYYPNNVPVYIGATNSRGAGSPIHRQPDGWNSYIPRSNYWTTERTVHVNAYHKPNDISTYRNGAWKPCYCLTTGNEYRQRRDNTPQHNHQRQQPQGILNAIKLPTSLTENVDRKLEGPFSKK